ISSQTLLTIGHHENQGLSVFEISSKLEIFSSLFFLLIRVQVLYIIFVFIVSTQKLITCSQISIFFHIFK
ncbi:hypothetical protein HOA93_06085, partial [bacterium]|nr:hypothetical protein [bacterium]